MQRDRVVIVGAGAVGCTFAYTLLIKGTAREIVLIDKDEERARGEAMDLNHGLFFVPAASVWSGTFKDCADARIVVITAGAKQKPGESRLELVGRNAAICRQVVADILEHTREAIIIMVTNPVDVLTYLVLKESGLPRERVLGSGTVLDSARFRYMLSDHSRVDAHNVHAYIVGEHGDSEVALWSATHIAGVPVGEYCNIVHGRCTPEARKEIFEQVRDSAYHVIESKGATYYAVSLALERIVRAILRNESSVLTVSSLIEGQYGIEDVCLSLPTVVDQGGGVQILDPPLSGEEVEALRNSAEVLKGIIAQVLK